MLRLTFLGTGTSQGVPMIACDCEVCCSTDKRDKRLRTSAMVEFFSDPPDGKEAGTNCAAPDTRIIIDAGPDFRYQMLREKIKSIDAILLTHEHRDHIAGIDDIRAFNYFENRSMPVYATDHVTEIIRREYHYAFGEHRYPGVPEIDLRIINSGPFSVNGIEVIPVFGSHLQLPVTGFRIGNLAYLTDFNRICEKELAKIEGIDVLVINALRHETHISHFSVSEAVEVCLAVGAKQTYFTHMSHQIGLYETEKDKLPDGVFYAYDGLSVDIM